MNYDNAVIDVNVGPGCTDHGLAKDLFLAQYSALRSEIEKRLDIRQGLLTFTLVVAATFLSLAVQSGISGMTAFFYPCVGACLAAAWTHNDARIGQINHYIQHIVEPLFPPIHPGWETYRKTTFHRKHVLMPWKGLIDLSARGTFLITELLCLFLGDVRVIALFAQRADLGTILVGFALSLLGTVATILTHVVLEHRR